MSTKTDQRVGKWAASNIIELAHVPFYSSWLNLIEAQFTALRYFALDGTDHHSHRQQASMIRRYIAWRTGTLPIPSSARSSTEPKPSRGRRLPDPALNRPGQPVEESGTRRAPRTPIPVAAPARSRFA